MCNRRVSFGKKSNKQEKTVARIKIQYPEKTIYRQDIRVRIGDLSASGHLAFDSLVGILNDASAGFFKANGIERGSRSSPHARAISCAH